MTEDKNNHAELYNSLEAKQAKIINKQPSYVNYIDSLRLQISWKVSNKHDVRVNNHLSIL
jgi:hypothetical protein